MGAVDEALGQVELAVSGKVFGEALEDLLEDPAFDPPLITAVRRLIRRVPPWKIGPRRPGAKDPKRSVDDVTGRLPRTSRLFPSSPLA